MNWVEALATIYFLTVDISNPMGEVKEVFEWYSSTNDVSHSLIKVETIEQMLEVFKVDEANEEEENEYKQWLHLCYFNDLEANENTRKEEVKYQHNIPNDIPWKTRKANRKGIIIEKMNEKALEETLQEESSDDLVPLRDVPQYFKDYIIDEVVIVLPQTIRSNPDKGESSEGGVFDGLTMTKEINLTNEGELDKLVWEHLSEEESEKL